MKPIYTLIAALLLFSFVQNSQAQTFPNGGMEDWEITTVILTPFEHPEGYLSSDMLGFPLGIPSGGVIKSSDAKSGSHSVQLKNVVDSIGASILLGDVNLTTFDIVIGDAWSGERPPTFNASYKETLLGTDTAILLISLLENGNLVAIGGAQFAPGSAGTSSWTDVSDSLLYFSTATPDSIQVIALIGSQSLDSTAPGLVTIGSTIWLDDMSLEMVTGVESPLFSKYQVNVFPNPSSDLVNFEIVRGESAQVDMLKVFDMTGKDMKVDVRFNSDKECIDLSNLGSGQFVYQLLDREGNPLKAGTFSKF